MSKPAKKSKTVWVNLIVSIAALLGLSEYFSEENIVVLLSVINIILRFVSNEKVSLR